MTTNKGLSTPAYGAAGWNVDLNDNFTIIDKALGSKSSINVATAPAILTSTEYNNIIIEFSGIITANKVFQIPSGVGGQWIVRNTTTGSYTITIANAAGTGTSVVVDQGSTVSIFSDGTNIRSADIPGSSSNVIFNDNDIRINGFPTYLFNKSSSSSVVRGSRSISSISWSSGTGTATITLSSAIETDINLSGAGYITIRGVTSTGGTSLNGYNGVWAVISGTGTTVTCTIPASLGTPGTYTSGGTIYYGRVQTGTITIASDPVTVTADEINAAGADKKSYFSGTSTFNSGVIKTYFHSIGNRPKFIQIFLECTTTEAGYAVGDIIYPCPNSSTSTSDRFNSIYADETNVWIRTSSATKCFVYGHKTTGAIVEITNTSWKIGISAHL